MPGGGSTDSRVEPTRIVCTGLIVLVVGGVLYTVVTQTFSTSGRIGLAVAGGIAVVALGSVADPSTWVSDVLVGFQRAIDRLSQGLGWIAKWTVPVVVVVGFVNVVLRYAGRWLGEQLTSNRWVELQWMLFGVIFLTAFPYVLKHGINVRVDFVFQRFSTRVKALIDFAGHLLGLVPYCIFAIWATWDTAFTSLFQRTDRWGTWRVWEVWEESPDAGGLPRAPVKLLLLAAFFFLLAQTIAELIKLGFVLGGKEGQTEAEEIPEAPLRIE